jgi:hypothetical protein
MQYLHQSTYGHAGGVHTARPIMAMDKGHIYDIKGGQADLSKPLYRLHENRAYATDHHPGGSSLHAAFEIRGDKVHTTEHHPHHDPDKHTFEIRGMMT